MIHVQAFDLEAGPCLTDRLLYDGVVPGTALMKLFQGSGDGAKLAFAYTRPRELSMMTLPVFIGIRMTALGALCGKAGLMRDCGHEAVVGRPPRAAAGRQPRRDTGSLEPKRRAGRRPAIGSDQTDAWQARVAQHPDATLADHCAQWSANVASP